MTYVPEGGRRRARSGGVGAQNGHSVAPGSTTEHDRVPQSYRASGRASQVGPEADRERPNGDLDTLRRPLDTRRRSTGELPTLSSETSTPALRNGVSARGTVSMPGQRYLLEL